MGREGGAVTEGPRIGLIAGNGRFPVIFADNARRLGYQVYAVAHVGETEPELADHVDRIHWIKIGQLNKLVQALKSEGVTEAVMLGGVKKTHVFTTVRPDFRTLAMAARLAIWRDDDILREFAAELEREGIMIRESTFGLEGVLVEEGVLSSRTPTDKEWEDIRYGWEVAREIGRLDIGQCRPTVELGLAGAEQVEVRAVVDGDQRGGHGRLILGGEGGGP